MMASSMFGAGAIATMGARLVARELERVYLPRLDRVKVTQFMSLDHERPIRIGPSD